MRCESTLQAKRYPEAVAWTCTFFDAALLDAIEKQPWCEKLDDFKKSVRVQIGETIPEELTASLQNNRGCLNNMRTQDSYVYMTSGIFKEKWLELLKIESLTNYSNALQTKKYDYISPLDLRNLNMHSIMNQDFSQKITRVFHEAGLWASEEEAKNRENLFFLNNDLSKGILKSFNLDPAKLYKEDIVNNLLKELDNYEIQ